MKKHVLHLMLFLSVLTGPGCSQVRFIANYDETADQLVRDLQQSVTLHLFELESLAGNEEAAYPHFETFYSETKTQALILKSRVYALEKAEILQKQVEELMLQLKNLELLHKAGFSTAEEVTPLIQAFSTTFIAITKLHMALKRGEELT